MNGVKNYQPRFPEPFLEVLRDLGTEAKTAVKESSVLVSGVLSPGKTTEISADEISRVKQVLFREKSLFQEEKVLRTREQNETRIRIQTLQNEIKKLSTAKIELDRHVKIAILQTTPSDPGEYHASLLEKILDFVSSLRKNIESASHWLAAFNQRGKKKNYYWKQVKKSGSRFYLSADRYSATQAG